mmetsp:Transcript_35179/g.56993  ORF Transcript_35179/g.56993 Transcript_35179/m.56993 type:complete len:89 (+) Transcript_35179:171-437(+)
MVGGGVNRPEGFHQPNGSRSKQPTDEVCSNGNTTAPLLMLPRAGGGAMEALKRVEVGSFILGRRSKRQSLTRPTLTCGDNGMDWWMTT